MKDRLEWPWRAWEAEGSARTGHEAEEEAHDG